jgi:hypothetical protein
MKQYLELAINIPTKGKALLKFDYSTSEEKSWAWKQVKQYKAIFGPRNILSLNEREEQ